MEFKLYTKTSAAKALHISPPTLQRAIDAGEVQTIELDGRTWISHRELIRVSGGESLDQ